MAQRRRRSSYRRHATRRRAKADGVFMRRLALGVLGLTLGLIVARSLWPSAAVPPNLARPLSMAQARASNAAVSVERRRRGRAAAYRFRGRAAEREQAVACLATAALYEAGADRAGQEAVVQVVLNRVRARGFPKTICGVVYQGSARRTGCQFSFTCDGSFQRRPVHLGWAGARRVARRALTGHVFDAVGRATHYHADWLVPYWMPTLSKIAQIHSHIFYRPHHAGDEPANGVATASP